jgi:hypothetical protein
MLAVEQRPPRITVRPAAAQGRPNARAYWATPTLPHLQMSLPLVTPFAISRVLAYGIIFTKPRGEVFISAKAGIHAVCRTTYIQPAAVGTTREGSPRKGFALPNYSDMTRGLVHRSPWALIGQTLDTAGRSESKSLKWLALPSGIEPLSPP